MGRLIDADAIIQAVCTKLGIKDKKFLLQSEKAIVDVILNAPTIEAPTWIPCSERLPSEETSVLVTFGYGEIGIDIHTDGWANNGWIWHDDVIAWMPLPRPYEETDHE